MIQRTRPSHAVCGEVRKDGWTAGERYKVSSKTEGLETLGALRREGGFTAQWPGFGPLSAESGTVLGLASSTPGPNPNPSAPRPHPCPCSADPPSQPRAAEHRSMLNNLGSTQGHPGLQTALPHVFHTPLGTTFLPALPVPRPPLSADALAPAQSLEKE